MTGIGIPNSHSKMPRPMTIPPILVAVKNFSVGFMFHLRDQGQKRQSTALSRGLWWPEKGFGTVSGEFLPDLQRFWRQEALRILVEVCRPRPRFPWR